MINYPDAIEVMAHAHWRRDIRGDDALADWRELARQLRQLQSADAVDPSAVSNTGKPTTRENPIPEFS